MDDIRGKMLLEIKCRGSETFTFMKKHVINLVPIFPVYTKQKSKFIISILKPIIEHLKLHQQSNNKSKVDTKWYRKPTNNCVKFELSCYSSIQI